MSTTRAGFTGCAAGTPGPAGHAVSVYLDDPRDRRPRPSPLRPTPALSGPVLAALTRAERRRDHRRVTTGLVLPRDQPADLRARSLAVASLYPDGVLCGWSAVAIHGCATPDDALPEISVGSGMRRRQGVRIRRYEVPAAATVEIAGARVTTPRWTAFDLARFLPFEDAVISVESLHGRILRLEDLGETQDAVRGMWGAARARRVFAAADGRSESPMETRVRLLLHAAGFSTLEPQVQVPELGYRLDLADRRLRIAVEYDGDGHFDDPARARRDARRRTRLAALGWTVIVVTKELFYREPDEVVRLVGRAYAIAA